MGSALGLKPLLHQLGIPNTSPQYGSIELSMNDTHMKKQFGSMRIAHSNGWYNHLNVLIAKSMHHQAASQTCKRQSPPSPSTI